MGGKCFCILLQNIAFSCKTFPRNGDIFQPKQPFLEERNTFQRDY